jgi:hypothetical protein
MVPLDFYSWHIYPMGTEDPDEPIRLALEIRGVLDAHGFPKAESILSEWNLTPNFTDAGKDELRSAHDASFIGAVMSYFQDAPLDRAMFYRGDAAWMGLFDLQGRYYKTAYAFKAMGKMLDSPQRIAVEGTDTFGMAVLAGRSPDGKSVQILISNYAIPANYKPSDMRVPAALLVPQAPPPENHKKKSLAPRTGIIYRNNAGYNLVIRNLPWDNAAFNLKRYRISNTQNLDLVEERSLSGDSLRLSNPLPVDTVELLVLQMEVK